MTFFLLFNFIFWQMLINKFWMVLILNILSFNFCWRITIFHWSLDKCISLLKYFVISWKLIHNNSIYWSQWQTDFCCLLRNLQFKKLVVFYAHKEINIHIFKNWQMKRQLNKATWYKLINININIIKISNPTQFTCKVKYNCPPPLCSILTFQWQIIFCTAFCTSFSILVYIL